MHFVIVQQSLNNGKLALSLKGYFSCFLRPQDGLERIYAELNSYPKGTSSLHCVAVRAPIGELNVYPEGTSSLHCVAVGALRTL